MINSDQTQLFQGSTATAPTAACNTINPCTQSGCITDMTQESASQAFSNFSAPSQQQNSTQTFQSAPGFLC